MAVYTRLEAAEVQALLDACGGGPLEGLEPIPEGIENTTYRVRAGGRRFVLTVFEREGPERVAAVLGATAALSRRGVPCPAPLDGPAGPLLWVRDKPAALSPFVEGRFVVAPTEAELEALGAALARFHLAGRDLVLAGGEGPHRAAVLAPLARRLAGRVRGGDPDLADLLEQEAAHQERVPEEGLPWGLLHADLFLDNVLFAPDRLGVAALLDFQMLGTGPWLYDLAVVLLDAGWKGRAVDGDLARALLRGYRALRPVEGQEYVACRDYLRRAALRFLCLRLERFVVDATPMVAGSGKDPAECAGKLRSLRRDHPNGRGKGL
ncbi:MAG: homoserine kinase [Deferrisomatales bacterium]